MNYELIDEAISDVSAIISLNPPEVARELIKGQFLVISKEDLPDLIKSQQQSPSLSLSAEQEAEEHLREEISNTLYSIQNEAGNSHLFTTDLCDQATDEILKSIAAYLAGKASGGDGWQEWLSIKGDRYVIVDDLIFKVHPLDTWDDGDFEADEIGGGDRVLISKNDSGFYVANAMNGWGNNCREKYNSSKVQLLLPTPPVK